MLNVRFVNFRCFSFLLLWWPVYVHTAGDSEHDIPILTYQSQFIAWAIGPRATEEGLGGLAFFHTEYPRNGGNHVV